MWTTHDCYTLRMPRSTLATIVANHRLLGLGGLVSRSYHDSLKHTILGAVGRLARNAYRSGILRHTRSGRRYLIFSARVDGERYHIIVRLLDGTRGEIVSIRRASYAAEYSDGRGHRIVQNRVIDILLRLVPLLLV